MHLLYFPVNAAYAFVFGSTIEQANLCQLYEFDMFFQTKGEAIEAARHRGLIVDLKTGYVSTPLHQWCIGEAEIARCPVCHAHLIAMLEASAAKRPFSNLLRGDIRTFNLENLPEPEIKLHSYERNLDSEDALCIFCNQPFRSVCHRGQEDAALSPRNPHTGETEFEKQTRIANAFGMKPPAIPGKAELLTALYQAVNELESTLEYLTDASVLSAATISTLTTQTRQYLAHVNNAIAGR